MIQLENWLMDLDEIWYRCYAIAGFPKIVFSSFLQLAVPIWWMNKLVRWD
jgi:hypothetical protein